MRNGKHSASRVVVVAAATAALLLARDQSMAAQGGRHHKRVAGYAARGASIPGVDVVRRAPGPYLPSFGYGYDLFSAGSASPYGNIYTSRSSGCCHGRN
ncbi:MAG: hypothetical protein JO105_19040 [Hyphomicrobiales bacterium]|nr:hypothetical protein [Hyphomicrobiales bacterium]